MSGKTTKKSVDKPQVWVNGKMVPWEAANCHLMTHALHYGSSVFEGIRAYETDRGTAIFRLDDHIQRLFYSAKVYRIDVPYNVQAITQACHRVVSANGMVQAYIRPIVYRGADKLGLYAGPGSPIDAAVIALRWDNFLGVGEGRGIRACVSSWNRLAPNTMPAGVKAGGNYLSSQLITHEAHARGFDEGIGLTADGLLSEGAGENLFFVKQGVIYTPPASCSILGGITRDSVIHLARDRGIEVIEQALPREFLYAADEIFMTGTAAEITPVASVDDIAVGSGEPGPVTQRLRQAFFGLFSGATADTYGWLEYLEEDHVRSVAV